MSLVTLADVLQPALKNGHAVAGLVTLGWEDMRAYVALARCSDIWLKMHLCQLLLTLIMGIRSKNVRLRSIVVLLH